MTANPIAKAEFEQKWGPRPGYVAVPAEKDGPCDYDECEGWHWASKVCWEEDVEYGMRPASDLEAFA